MGRVYSIQFENIAVTAAQDFFEILPATQKPVQLHALFLAQFTDLGDAAEEILRIQVIRGHTTSGSGGAAVTPVAMDVNSTASGATCERNNTTIASAGTGAVLHTDYFNIRTGYQMIWTPEMRPRSQNPNLIVVRLMAAPTDSLTMGGTLYFEEL